MSLSQTIQPLSSLPLMFASCILSQVVTPQSESTLKTPTLNPFKNPTLNPFKTPTLNPCIHIVPQPSREGCRSLCDAAAALVAQLQAPR